MTGVRSVSLLYMKCLRAIVLRSCDSITVIVQLTYPGGSASFLLITCMSLFMYLILI